MNLTEIILKETVIEFQKEKGESLVFDSVNDWWREFDRYVGPSHGSWHINMVLNFARQLHGIYGGDLDVIIAAAIMHDLGRKQKGVYGDESIKRSLLYAEPILSRIEQLNGKREQVLLAISEHDKEEYRPKTIEGRILKDSDYIAGFGAWGILRIALHVGENMERIDGIKERLEKKYPSRIEGLEFQESRLFAIEGYFFSRLFIAMMDRPNEIRIKPKVDGRYIVFEGISGTGKDTQILRTKNYLEEKGKKVKIIVEPNKLFTSWKRKLKETGVNKNHTRNSYLLLASRYEYMNLKIDDYLARGYFVLSNRSPISTLVYQASDDFNRSMIAFLHTFMPQPDLVLIYDLSEEIALDRVKERPERGEFENEKDIVRGRVGYMNMARWLSPVYPIVIIDSSNSKDDVEELTIAEVNAILEQE